MPAVVRVGVDVGNLVRYRSDVIALKYQGILAGAAGLVANALGIREPDIRRALPSVGDVHLLAGDGKIGARHALFVHVAPVASFSYDHIREFSSDVLRVLRERVPDARHVAMTVHGVRFGMDLDRSLRAHLNGWTSAVTTGDCPRELERITVVNQNADDVRDLQGALRQLLPDATLRLPAATPPAASSPAVLPPPPSASVAARPSLFDIFISFKSEDEAYAQQIFAYLTARGLRVFFSRQSLPRLGSDEYHAQIDRAIEQARHMVVVTTSPANVNAQWVQYEWRLFLGERLAGRKTGNLVTAIAGRMTIDDLPISLRNREVIRCDEDGLTRLAEYMRGDIDGQPGEIL
jgi:hypothetical protein